MLMSALQQLAAPQLQRQMMTAAQYRELAERKIALCYVLYAGDTPCAAIIGIRFQGVYHVHNILYDPRFASFSPGTTIMHLATEQLIERQQTKRIDYGYGEPRHLSERNQVTSLRGQVCIYRRHWATDLRLAMYSAFGTWVERVKSWTPRRGQAWAPPGQEASGSPVAPHFERMFRA